MTWRKEDDGKSPVQVGSQSNMPAKSNVIYDENTGFCILEIDQVKAENAGEKLFLCG